MFCKNCGAEVPANTAFCSKCGAPVENAAQAAPVQAAPAAPAAQDAVKQTVGQVKSINFVGLAKDKNTYINGIALIASSAILFLFALINFFDVLSSNFFEILMSGVTGGEFIGYLLPITWGIMAYAYVSQKFDLFVFSAVPYVAYAAFEFLSGIICIAKASGIAPFSEYGLPKLIEVILKLAFPIALIGGFMLVKNFIKISFTPILNVSFAAAVAAVYAIIKYVIDVILSPLAQFDFGDLLIGIIMIALGAYGCFGVYTLIENQNKILNGNK